MSFEADFFRSRLDQMIDLRSPLAILASRMPWQEIEVSLAHHFKRQIKAGKKIETVGLFGPEVKVVGAGSSNAGRPRLSIRIMVSLLYLKHAFNESDEGVVERWGETPTWQYFSGMDYFEHRMPCDGSLLSKFRKIIGEEGVERLLAQTIAVALNLKMIAPSELQTVVVDTTVQPKAIAHPTDSRLLEMARQIESRMSTLAHAVKSVVSDVLSKAQRIVTQSQTPKSHGIPKLYSWHAPEVEVIAKGKARTPYEFGVKVGVASTLRGNLIVGARSFPHNPYDGHTLQEQLEQASILSDSTIKDVYVDLGYRGVDQQNPTVSIKHRGKYKRLSDKERRLLKRRQAIEPIIGHLKSDHRMNRCHLKGANGDAIHAVLCAAGYNIRWLLRVIRKKGLGLYFLLIKLFGLAFLWSKSSPKISIKQFRSTPSTALLAGC
jgi:IS5 family transposase